MVHCASIQRPGNPMNHACVRNDFSLRLGSFSQLKIQHCHNSTSGLNEKIRIHSCLYTESCRATVCRIIQNPLTLTRQKTMMKGWLSINPSWTPKSFTRSGVHNSSCGEVLEIVPSNELQPSGPPPLVKSPSSLRRS